MEDNFIEEMEEEKEKEEIKFLADRMLGKLVK